MASEENTAAFINLINAIRFNRDDIVEQILDKEGISPDMTGGVYEGYTLTPLTMATLFKSWDTLDLLLDRGADVNLGAPIIIASKEGDSKTLRRLISAGADLNVKDKNGKTALMWAAERGKFVKFEDLVWNGADINTSNAEGKTIKDIIMQGLSKRQDEDLLRCKEILEEFEEISRTDPQRANNVKLVYACRRGDLEEVKSLLAKGTRIDTKPPKKSGQSRIVPLEDAAQNGHTEVVKELFKYIEPDSIAKEVWATASWGQTKMLETFINAGFDVNSKVDEYDDTLLNAAARHNRFGTVKMLLAKGANVNAKKENGKTVLMDILTDYNALRDRSPEKLRMMKLLIDNGADINARDKDGDTALMKASKPHLYIIPSKIVDKTTGEVRFIPFGEEAEPVEKVKLLIDNGADVNVKDASGGTPLMYASVWGNTKMVKTLLKNGADINARDNEGNTALMYASFYDKFRSVPSPINAGNELMWDSDFADDEAKQLLKVEKVPSFRAVSHHIDTVKTLLKNGADVNAANKNGETALMVTTSCSDNPEMVKLLFDNGADVNAQDKNGNTALSLAKAQGHTKTVETLIDGGADVNSRNNDDNVINEHKTIQNIKRQKNTTDRQLDFSEDNTFKPLKKVVSQPNKMPVFKVDQKINPTLTQNAEKVNPEKVAEDGFAAIDNYSADKSRG